jgi:hypothetical protein
VHSAPPQGRRFYYYYYYYYFLLSDKYSLVVGFRDILEDRDGSINLDLWGENHVLNFLIFF